MYCNYITPLIRLSSVQHGTLKRQLDKPGQKISFVVRKISNLQRANFFCQRNIFDAKEKKLLLIVVNQHLKLHTCGLWKNIIYYITWNSFPTLPIWFWFYEVAIEMLNLPLRFYFFLCFYKKIQKLSVFKIQMRHQKNFDPIVLTALFGQLLRTAFFKHYKQCKYS